MHSTKWSRLHEILHIPRLRPHESGHRQQNFLLRVLLFLLDWHKDTPAERWISRPNLQMCIERCEGTGRCPQMPHKCNPVIAYTETKLIRTYGHHFLKGLLRRRWILTVSKPRVVKFISHLQKNLRCVRSITVKLEANNVVEELNDA
jgi:hypothetical protein